MKLLDQRTGGTSEGWDGGKMARNFATSVAGVLYKLCAMSGFIPLTNGSESDFQATILSNAPLTLHIAS